MTYSQDIHGAKRSMFWVVGSRIRIAMNLSEINQRPRGDVRRNCFICLEELQRARRFCKSSAPGFSSHHIAGSRRYSAFV